MNVKTTTTMTQPGESTKCMWTGSYAEFMAVPADDVAMMPPSLSFEQAAGLPPTALTAWQVRCACPGMINQAIYIICL